MEHYNRDIKTTKRSKEKNPTLVSETSKHTSNQVTKTGDKF